MTKNTPEILAGGCPSCRDYSRVLNVGERHYAVCDTHKMAWYLGSNIFDGWLDEDIETWEQNECELENFHLVTTLPHQPRKSDRNRNMRLVVDNSKD